MSTTKIGTCPTCDSTYRVEGTCVPTYLTCTTCASDPAYLAARDAFLTEHPRGHYPTPSAKMARLSGRVSATKCDGACTSAKGEKCICECGGKHHGERWAM